MRILYVTQNYLPEMGAGPGRISEMAREWVAAGHEVEVLAPVPNHPVGVIHPEYRGKAMVRERDSFGVESTRIWIYTAANRGRIRRSLAFSSFGALGLAAGALIVRRPNVVIGSSPQLLAGLAGFGIARLRKLPWVFEVRDLWPESFAAVGAMRDDHPLVMRLHALADRMYRSANKVVVVTEMFREILVSRGIAPDRIAYIPNGVDLTRFNPRPARASDRELLGGGARFIVTYIGTHGMAHDLGRLLDVASRMRARRDVAFAFVGEGAERKALEARAKAEGLSNVRFLGVLPRERMPELYAASDLCVVPLRKSEVFTSVLPSKIFEIMGMAKPLVLAVDGEARRVVEQGGAGRFVPPGDTDALQRGIEDFLSAPDAMVRAGESGREYVARAFNRVALARRYLEVLEGLVHR